MQCMISKSNVKQVCATVHLTLFSSKQCIIKQFLDEIFVISEIIEDSASVTGRG